MKLLLHTCCAPCAIYPVTRARKENFQITGFFYNPNIHPPLEFKKRKEEAEKYFKSEGIELISYEGHFEDFFDKIKGKEFSKDRCLLCWEMRLQKTVKEAKEKNYNAFTTTLLESPYQDHEYIKNLSLNLAKKNGIEFFYEDFREGFKFAHAEAKERGIYSQNYCGCVFSLVEREEKKSLKGKRYKEKENLCST